ncbi:antirestriction protein ArdA [Arthrobacter sp. MI7-26]|uniref:antirestriction protein ArdA n=1 Tax=Arthrobacter sp. MI7-26 TaxID=2993653 RepID=UPI00224918FC|nr:antirestriction protein ArdA [Arthrobacter sp. MI7-26]MCX2746247.1 antirestriction protein ArdA [Arthrobacter sp. MI7-26]
MEHTKELAPRRSDPERGHSTDESPWIYITSAADYLANVRHSAWIRADQTPEEMQAQIDAFMEASPALRSAAPGEPGWFIEEKIGFYGYGPYLGDELTEISTIGRGIAEYGEAFVAYAMEHGGGRHDETLLTEFEEYFVAEYADAEICLDEFLESMGWSQALEEFKAVQGIDCPLDFDRSCIWEKYKQAWEVIEGRNGIIYVFNT